MKKNKIMSLPFALILFLLISGIFGKVLGQEGAEYETNEAAAEVGYSAYSYVTYPGKWGDAEPPFSQNRAPDLLPQNVKAGENFEEELGELVEESVNGGANPDAVETYSVIWDRSQIVTEPYVDLVEFELDGESGVEEVRLSSFFHTVDYDVPNLKISILTKIGSKEDWVEIGSEEGLDYIESTLRRLAITTDSSVIGTRLKISASARNSSAPKDFSLGGVIIVKKSK